MGEVLCFRAQGHAGAEFVNVRQRVALVASVHADERARVPSFVHRRTRRLCRTGGRFDRVSTCTGKCGFAWQSSWADPHMHGIECVDLSRLYEQANEFAELVAGRCRSLR